MKRKQTKEMVNACSVCFDERGWDENPLVYCDGANCNIAVHQACYGILSVPKGNWYCRKCESQDTSARCELCPFKGGALKQTDNGKWAHVVCALYIPEVKFANVTTMEPIVLSDVPKDRFSEICSICTKKGWLARSNVGACMRCNKANCKQQFHVSCAQRAGLLCEETGKNMNNIKYCGYCEEHAAKAKKNNTAGVAASGKRSQAYESPSSREDESTPESACASTAKQTQKKKHFGNNSGKLYSTLKKDATSPHNLNLIISLSSNPPTVIESPSKAAEATENNSKVRAATGKGRKHKASSPRAGVANDVAPDAGTVADGKTDNDAAATNLPDAPPSDSFGAGDNADAVVDVNSSSDDKGFCADARKKKSKHRKHFYNSSSASSSFKKHRFGRKKKYVNFEQSAAAAFDDDADGDATTEDAKAATAGQCPDHQLTRRENAQDAENGKLTSSSPSETSMKTESEGNMEAGGDCASASIDEGLLAAAVKVEASSDETAAKQCADEGRKSDPTKSAKTVVASRYNRVLEELLEKQWEQAGAFLMEQAGHYRVSDLLNELHQVRAEIIREEENQKALLMRRNHLLAVNARLSISNMMPEYTNFVANRDLQTDTEQTLLTGLPISSQMSFQQTKVRSPTSLQDASSQKAFDSK